jgi:hypothetical protein
MLLTLRFSFAMEQLTWTQSFFDIQQTAVAAVYGATIQP